MSVTRIQEFHSLTSKNPPAMTDRHFRTWMNNALLDYQAVSFILYSGIEVIKTNAGVLAQPLVLSGSFWNPFCSIQYRATSSMERMNSDLASV